ncbi:hypothetical protein [Enterococcus sp. CSURQ0835]|uniref:hypothetical protein n=1 Tax=Enterococcus sp. CSURQ0835 TaxID=2681394 RepID=UPI001357DE18|nr:hypothetical protein [Enterococcus sp. CSURQ0835]
MEKQELLAQIKKMLEQGNVEEAKKFIEEHQSDSSEWVTQAKEMLGHFDPDGVAKNFKDL